MILSSLIMRSRSASVIPKFSLAYTQYLTMNYAYQVKSDRSNLVTDHFFEFFESELILHSIENLGVFNLFLEAAIFLVVTPAHLRHEFKLIGIGKSFHNGCSYLF